ncbi:hypothetical protein Efla_005758 [Eimeria flavescens]
MGADGEHGTLEASAPQRQLASASPAAAGAGTPPPTEEGSPGSPGGPRGGQEEGGSCLQSSQLRPSSEGASCCPTAPSSPHPFAAAAQPPERSPLLGAYNKGELLDVLRPLVLWLFPNLLVGLVFACTLAACLLRNATITCEVCFLLLLVPSWLCLAAAANRRLGAPPASAIQPEALQPQPRTAAPPAGEGQQQADASEEREQKQQQQLQQEQQEEEEAFNAREKGRPEEEDPILSGVPSSEEEARAPLCLPAAGWPLEPKPFADPPAIQKSCSTSSVETCAPSSCLQDCLVGALSSFEGGAPFEGPLEELLPAHGQSAAVCCDAEAAQQGCAAPPAATAAASAATAAAAASEEKEEAAAEAAVLSAASFLDYPLVLREAEAAETPRERERTIDVFDGSEAAVSSEEDAEEASLGSSALHLLHAAAASSSSSSSRSAAADSDFSLWLGALGEASILSASLSDLSFCRTQTLSATLSPRQQSTSVELEDLSSPVLPVSCLAERPDPAATKGALPVGAPPGEAAAEAPPSLPSPLFPHLGASAPPEQHRGAPSPSGGLFSLILRGEDSEMSPLPPPAPHVVAFDRLLQEQQEQPLQQQPQPLLALQQPQQPLLQQPPAQQQLQQQHLQQQQLQRGVFASRGGPAASGVSNRRGGGGCGSRRLAGGGPPGGLAKAQRRESRAALQYYMGLVKDCCKRRDGAGALRVLEEVQREGRVAPDVQLLNYVLFACVASQDAFLTRRLFSFIEAAGVADIVTYNTMLKSFSVSGQLEEAEKILRRMRERSVPPDEVSFNLLVNAAVSCGRIDRAWYYVDELKTANMVPDKFTISSLVKSLQPGQNLKLIQRTLRLMDGVDVCEDLILLSTCIDATLRLGDMDRLRRLLARFEASSLTPNAHAYGTLIKAYGRLGNLSRVWGLWRDLQSKKMEPTNYTYGCMLDILVSNNWLADAKQLFCRMVQQGVVDSVHFSILVKGLAKLHAREGERPQQQQQPVLNTISFNALLHLCVVNKRMDDALRVFRDMETQGSAAPDLISYSTVIKGLCCCPGDAPLEKALSLLDQMQRRYGIKPDAIVFNTLIQGAATRKDPLLVEHLLTLMQQSNVPPSSYTLCQCVKLYGKCNNLKRALELAKELPSRFGFPIDGYVYTALISACLENGAALLAGELALQAHATGVDVPQGVLFKVWASLHASRAAQQETAGEQQTAEVEAVYERMLKLVGPLAAKDPLPAAGDSAPAAAAAAGGGGLRRSRRRSGKQQSHPNNTGRQKQQGGPAAPPPPSSNVAAARVNGLAGCCPQQDQQRLGMQQLTVGSLLQPSSQSQWEGAFELPLGGGGPVRPPAETEVAGGPHPHIDLAWLWEHSVLAAGREEGPSW